MDHRIEGTLATLHHAQLGNRISLAALAGAAHLSLSRFAHLFQQEVGTPPGRYIHALRMIRARILIERTSLSIKQVMEQVGCTDPSHFTRDFRRFHGLSPREWRRATTQPTVDADTSDVLDSASVTRIAALANERQPRATKPSPRARAPDSVLHRAW